MGNHSPVYNLIFQEIKACAEHLLEVCQNHYFNEETDSKHIISRLSELHQFSQKLRLENHYHPLMDLKYYLENTMLSYPDANQAIQSMRLSEAIALLERPDFEICNFNKDVARSLHNRCVRHCYEEIKSGRTLHCTLQQIKGI